MKTLGRLITCMAFSFTLLPSAQAVSTFGALALGNDLEPVSVSLVDGGEGSSSASVSFTTFEVESFFDPASTYLPILKARSTGLDSLFDDDRTNTSAEAYQVFSSSIAQTITLDIRLDSVVTNLPASGGLPEGTSGVLSNIYVIGGPDFGIQRGSCSGGRFTFDSIYLCGDRIAESSRNGLNFSNLFNGGDNPLLIDSLEFSVLAGESFGIYAELSAGSFRGTADAFNTLTLGFVDDQFIEVAEVPGTPAVVPLPAGAWLFLTGVLGIFGLRRRIKS